MNKIELMLACFFPVEIPPGELWPVFLVYGTMIIFLLCNIIWTWIKDNEEKGKE